jgi:acyl-CoA dehydrogenase
MDMGSIEKAAALTVKHPVPDSRGLNLFEADPDFFPLLKLYGGEKLAEHLKPYLHRLGALAGDALDALAGEADRNPPQLQHRNRQGQDEQRILKHPAYVEMEKLAFGEFALAAISHRDNLLGWQGRLPPIAKYALTYLFVQAEFGLCCPVSMTDSLTRTLKKFGSPALIDRYLPALTSLNLESLFQGAMFMTEQGAGSDVAATQTQAFTVEGKPGEYQLFGDKWFCSNADADLAMVLARTQGNAEEDSKEGISLFLMPKRLQDGSHNAYRIVRLKDKLGTRSMASGEIKLEGATAYLIGEPGRGFVQMADMVNNSRLSNGVRAAGLMRRAVSEASFIANERTAFGKRLVDMPLMQRQLSKMRLSMEQSRSMMFQCAKALEAADKDSEGKGKDSQAYKLLRILTPLIKFRACRDARKVTGDAMEVRGGCGYIEEWPDARLLRDAHLGSIWEGTSNIVALDVLRAIQKDNALPALETLWDRMLNALNNKNLRPALEQAKNSVKHQLHAALKDESLAREAASATYHLTSAISLAWEADQSGLTARASLAQSVLVHRLRGH